MAHQHPVFRPHHQHFQLYPSRLDDQESVELMANQQGSLLHQLYQIGILPQSNLGPGAT